MGHRLKGWEFAAAAIAMAAPAMAAAQQPGSLQDFRLDPARDPSRRPAEREGPEVDNRPSAALPGASPAPAQTPAPAPAPARNVPMVQPIPATPPPTPAPAAPRTAAPQAAPRPVPAPPTAAPDPTADPTSNAPRTIVPSGLPSPAQKPSEPPQTAPVPAAPEPVSSDGNSGWIAAALVALGTLAGGLLFFLYRRRRPRRRAPADEAPHISPQPAAEPVAPPPPAVGEPAALRPALSLAFEVVGARFTLIGVTVDYRVTLRNEGEAPARSIRVGAMLANAHAGQEQALARFFAAPIASPAHGVEALAPGESATLSGALRLANEALAPIRVQDRALLIPVAGFSAHYEWDGDGRGYSGAAFIVGQESDPPTARMAPFRLDQGPRQFRQVGSRLGQTALVS